MSTGLWIGTLASAGGVMGDFESIATVTVGSGGASSISFSSIPGTYQHLQIRFYCYANSTGYLSVRPNGNSATGQYSHRLGGNGASVYGQSSSDNRLYMGLHDAAGYFAAVIDVLDYASTTKNKTVRSISGSDRNGAGDVQLSSGLYASTSAITSFDLLTTGTGWAQHSTAALYGIKAP